MLLTRVFGNSSKTAVAQCRNLIFLSHPLLPPQQNLHHHRQLSVLSRRFQSPSNFSLKTFSFHNGLRSQRGMSTSAPHEHEQENKAETAGQSDETTSAKTSEQTRETGSNSDSKHASQSDKKRRRGTKRTAFSDSDSEVDFDDLSREELVKVLFEKEEVLQKKEKEFGEWKDKFLRSYAEMENVMERTRRDAENSKKFAVQSFAKSLLDVADNLSRASSVTKESFGKIDVSGDTIGAVPVLKTLLEGVEMTEKQLAEVFRKSGIEKIDPTNEQFDPNRDNAVFQVPDSSKPPGTVAVVLKAGYKLHDRIIRPAEVGVTVAVENNEANS
ncbi:hypothetical protein RND81_09G056000 [Saponaria officinalis]|uniref:GrpE protein homolog n=1 Tax=Saponaria officinalis TaxID=3572 RepID=A0AAW1IH29_SAPOF